jgi:hypothetical protein
MTGGDVTNPQVRLVGKVWLDVMSERENTHWTMYVGCDLEEEEEEEDFEEVFDRFHSPEPCTIEMDQGEEAILDLWPSVEVEFDDPKILDFGGTVLVKKTKVPETHSVLIAAEIANDNGLNVGYRVDGSMLLYPVCDIPNRFDQSPESSWVKDKGLLRLLVSADPPGMVFGDVSPFIFEGEDAFESSIIFEGAMYQADDRDPFPPDINPPGNVALKKFSGHIHLGPESELTIKVRTPRALVFAEAPAYWVGKSMSDETISRMDLRVMTFRRKHGLIRLDGRHRYDMMYKLLLVSGAFDRPPTYLGPDPLEGFELQRLMMHMWMVRSNLVQDPMASCFTFEPGQFDN